MLFKIDNSVIEFLKNENENKDNIIEAIEHLADAKRYGKHIIFADKQILDFLRKYENLNERTRNTFNYIYTNRTKYKNLFQYINIYIELTVKYETIIRKEEECQIYMLPINMLWDLTFLSETILLSENLLDVNIYNYMFEILKKSILEEGLIINFELKGGGGDTTAIEYKSIIKKRNRFCLCIIDNDKKYKECAEGDTCKKVIEIEGKNNSITKAIKLDCHEIENLIPIEVIKRIETNQQEWLESVKHFEKIESLESDEVKKYIDVKKGIELSQLSNAKKDIKYKEYWKNYLLQCGVLKEEDLKTITEQDFNVKEVKEKYNKILIKGFGDKFLKKVEIFLGEVIDNKKIDEIKLNCEYREIWEKILKELYSWGCAEKKVRY